MTPTGQSAAGSARSARRSRWEHPFADVTLGEDGRVALLHAGLATAEADLKQAAAANRILASLGEPRILQATDVERGADDRLLLRTPAVDGLTSVGESVGRPVRLSWAVHVLLEVCRALDAAHGLGVFHGALTPASVLVGPEPDRPTVKVTEFGLAHAFTTESWGKGPAQWQPFAPERMMGQQAGPTTDVYLVGSLAYALLAGRPVFEGDDVSTLLRCHAIEEPPKLHRLKLPQAVPRALSRILLRCLVKEAEDRFDGPADLADALRANMAKAWSEGAPSEGSGPVARTPGPKPKKLTTLADLRATLKTKEPASPIPPAPATKPRPNPAPTATPREASSKVKVAKRPTPTPAKQADAKDLATKVAAASARSPGLPKPKGLAGAKGAAPPPPPETKLKAGTGPHRVVAKDAAEDDKPAPDDEVAAPPARKPTPADNKLAPHDNKPAPVAAKAQDAEPREDEKPVAAVSRSEPAKKRMGWVLPAGVGLVAAAIVGMLVFPGDDDPQPEEAKKAIAAKQSKAAPKPDPAPGVGKTSPVPSEPEVEEDPPPPEPEVEHAPPPTRDTAEPEVEVAPEVPEGEVEELPEGEDGAGVDEPPVEVEEGGEGDEGEGDPPPDESADSGSSHSSGSSRGARARAYAKQAGAARRSGDTAKAIFLYKRALDLRPGYAGAASSLAFIYFNKGDYANAVRYGKLAVRYSPRNMDYRVKLGDTYFKMGRKGDAKAQWQRAAELGSNIAKKRLTKL